jgi:chromosome partitioning protein
MNATAPILDRTGSHEQNDAGRWSGVPVPQVIMRDACSRPRPTPHIIVFANEKGGVGKSTLAFHSCIALSHSGARVLTIDLDNRQRSLTRSQEMRAATCRALGVTLPSGKFLTLEKQSGALLDQEIRRAGNDTDFVVIDLPGADTATARYAMAIADTIVTPIGSSSYDISGLAQTHPATYKMLAPGYFASLVKELREERVKAGLPMPDWLVMKNRFRGGDRRLEAIADRSLGNISAELGFRIGLGLPESLSFRDLNAYGLTYLDIGLIPGLGKRRHRVETTIGDLLRQLELPGFQQEDKAKAKAVRPSDARLPRAPMSKDASAAYWNSMIKHKNGATGDL